MTDDADTLREQSLSATVVVFRSAVTDTRVLRSRLADLGVDYREIEMSMGDSAMRERFELLKTWNHWPLLPQIYLNGEFVGGVDELLAHPRLVELVPREAGARWGQLLGYGGLAPFIGGAAGMLAAPDELLRQVVANALLAYGAVVLAFVGAVHWGLALGTDRAPTLLRVSIIPALVAWVSLLVDPRLALPIQVVGFAAVYGYERARLWSATVPYWYRRLRLHLTLIVCFSHLAAWLVLFD